MKRENAQIIFLIDFQQCFLKFFGRKSLFHFFVSGLLHFFTRMFSLPCNFPHRSKFCRKEDFSTIKVTSKKVMEHNVDISTREITSKTYAETTGILRPSKLHRKKYVEKKLEYFDQQN